MIRSPCKPSSLKDYTILLCYCCATGSLNHHRYRIAGSVSKRALRPRSISRAATVLLAAQRPLSAAPLATSTDRHERRCATTPQDRAQLRGRASGVRCKAMLGRSDRKKRWNDARNMQLFLCHKSL